MSNDLNTRFKESVRWSFALNLLYGFCIVGIALLVPTTAQTVIAILGGVYALYYIFFRKYNKAELFWNSCGLFVVSMCIGSLVGGQMDAESLISVGVGISLVDVLSFTKYGRKTLNAKAMSNTNLLAKLILYGKNKEGKLIPTTGFGDYLYYSVWVSGVAMLTGSPLHTALGAALIYIGTGLNCLVISRLYKKENYKGLPATILPFLCVLPLLIFINSR